jgi:hypothetical protein
MSSYETLESVCRLLYGAAFVLRISRSFMFDTWSFEQPCRLLPVARAGKSGKWMWLIVRDGSSASSLAGRKSAALSFVCRLSMLSRKLISFAMRPLSVTAFFLVDFLLAGATAVSVSMSETETSGEASATWMDALTSGNFSAGDSYYRLEPSALAGRRFYVSFDV